jgi:hypothetical protein
MLETATGLDANEQVHLHVADVYPSVPSAINIALQFGQRPMSEVCTHLTVFRSSSFRIPAGVMPCVFFSSQLRSFVVSNPT